MIVRNHLLGKKEYKGRSCHAVDQVCPCRPCYNCHDCGHSDSYYGWVESFQCAVNYNTGCPQPKPEPQHILNKQRYCKCCRIKVPKVELTMQCQGEIKEGSFMTFGARQYRRCSATPTWIAADVRDVTFYGAMSLCDECKKVCEIQVQTASFQKLKVRA